MNEKQYIDCLNRFIATSEALIDCLVIEGAVCGILVAKNICTSDELEYYKETVRDMDAVQKAREAVDSLKKEIDQYLKRESEKMERDMRQEKLVQETLDSLKKMEGLYD